MTINIGILGIDIFCSYKVTNLTHNDTLYSCKTKL